jgi:SAM-dependent methyltransferase
MDEREGLVVDLGCGNGWYLRRMAARYPHLRGLGLDPGEQAAEQARQLAAADNLGDRLDFKVGDIEHFPTHEPVDLIALNRALHHLWGETEDVFGRLYRYLRPGGGVVVWEPHWPAQRQDLRQPRRQGMALQNLMEHVQGNRFLRPDEIVAAMETAGFAAEVHTFAEDSEAVIVGRRPA